MDRNDLHDMIAELMDSLREQTQTLASYEGRIPQIEIDIVLSNLRKVYEYTTKINLINQGLGLVRLETDQPVFQPSDSLSRSAEAVAMPLSAGSEPVNPASLPEAVATDASVGTPATNPVEPQPRPLPPAVKAPLGNSELTGFDEVMDCDTKPADPQPVVPPLVVANENHSGSGQPPAISSQPVKKTEPKSAAPAIGNDLFGFAPPTLADTLRTDSRPRVADRFAGNAAAESVASRLGSKVINDMKEAIGINDKFLLINELFKGNQHHYTQALHFLNNAESLDEAMGMFSRMFTELKWSEESKAAATLRSLIERRHGADSR